MEGDRDSLGHFIQLVALNDSTVAEQSATGNDLKGYGLHIPRQSIGHNRLSKTTNWYL